MHSDALVLPVLDADPGGRWRNLLRDPDPRILTVRRATIRQRDLFTLLHRHLQEVEDRYCFDRLIRHCLLGRNIYRIFLDEMSQDPYLAFDAPGEWTAGATIISALGLRVHFLPWMEGMVLVPELKDEPRGIAAINPWIVRTDGGDEAVAPGAPLPQGVQMPAEAKKVLARMKAAFREWLLDPNPKFTADVLGDGANVGRAIGRTGARIGKGIGDVFRHRHQ